MPAFAALGTWGGRAKGRVELAVATTSETGPMVAFARGRDPMEIGVSIVEQVCAGRSSKRKRIGKKLRLEVDLVQKHDMGAVESVISKIRLNPKSRSHSAVGMRNRTELLHGQPRSIRAH